MCSFVRKNIAGFDSILREEQRRRVMKEKKENTNETNVVRKFKRRVEHWQWISAGLIIFDMRAIAAAYFLALWLRFDCRFSMIPWVYLEAYLYFIFPYMLFSVLIFWKLRLYNSIWRFASCSELLRMALATVITFLAHAVLITLLYTRMPFSYYAFGIVLQFAFTLGIRFSYRFVLLERSRRKKNTEHSTGKRILLIGAGMAGQMILRDIRRAKEIPDEVCCFIDDNPNKWGRYIEGVPIFGGRDSIFEAVEKWKIDKIFLAIPSASPETKRDILNICKETGCELKNLPGIYQLANGEVKVSALRDVAVEDLLGRDPIRVNMEEIFDFLQGKVIMVTGGGGSIGSELCRQIAGHHPKQLIIFEIYENNAYDIQQELKKTYPDLNLKVLIGSVRDSRRLQSVFSVYRPEIVFHAAAHKHVPLMEDSPCEAIKNNAIGTYKTAYAAMQYGCKRFVLISTDKAVNPTNIMGASKRLCEMVIQSFDKMVKQKREAELPRLYAHAQDEDGSMENFSVLQHAETEFVAVRFGNVLGSNGSVIPLFKKQIAEGGPVTVTHPDIIRYFMTIPEAVSLVLQAGTFAKGGEIFVLDMGSPVKIDTLARNLIKLSGYKPDVDIPIIYTGLRPGEKLYEERLMAEEGLRKTSNKLINIGSPIPFDEQKFLLQLKELMLAAYSNDPNIVSMVEAMVSTFHPAGEHGSEARGMIYESLMAEAAAAAE